MADEESSSSPTAQNANLDPSLVLKTGEVTYNGQKYTLTAQNKGIQLVPSRQGKTGLELPWHDVVCVCEKTSKSANSKPESSSDGQGDTQSFIIHHVVKQKKSNKLRCESIRLHVNEGGAKEWTDCIEEKRKIGKPQKLLVIINPIGGKGQGRQVFEKQVRPLFDLAGIESIVKVTEYEKHAVEIASSFDLTTVDGVVASGGDGFYAEVLQGIMVQTQQKAGVDFNDPDAALRPPPVPIALMPTGTGNGVSGWVNGDVIDPVTSALNIVRGQTTKANVLSVHDEGKLVHYCGLRLAYGFLAQVMKRTDSLRWMRRARYPYAILGSAFVKKCVLDVQVEVLQAPERQDKTENTTDNSGDSQATPKWTDLGIKHVTSLTGWCAQFELTEDNNMVFNPFSSTTDLILHTHTGGFHHLNFLIKMVAKKKDLFDSPTIERHERVLGFRFRYVGERQASKGGNRGGQEEGASGASAPISEQEELSRILDFDGELVDSEVSSVDCRFLSRFIPVFGIEYVPK